MDERFADVTHPRLRAYLVALSECGVLLRACEAAGIDRHTPHYWRQRDPAFAQAEAEAKDIGAEVLVEEARRRAVEGVLKPVYQKGQLVGEERVYSDVLLIFLLKGARPEVYRDNVEHHHTGTIGVDHSMRLKASLEQARAARLSLVSGGHHGIHHEEQARP